MKTCQISKESFKFQKLGWCYEINLEQKHVFKCSLCFTTGLKTDSNPCKCTTVVRSTYCTVQKECSTWNNAVQIYHCMTSKYRESDLKACRTVCSLALVVLGCHTPICLCSAPSGRTHLEIQMTTSWPQGPRRPPILPVGQTGTDIEGKAIFNFNRPR